MKTQISRNGIQPSKRYSGVYQQQGRMITDSDWNELSDLGKQRLWDALLDAVKSGSPRGGGLAVNPDKTLQPGVLYVDGVPARLPGSAPVAYAAQPDFPNPQPLPAGNFSLYADVWDRAVTSLEDSKLIDPGLHGADTCTRTQTMLQVKWCPDSVSPENAAQNPPQGNAELKLKLRQILATADQCDPCAAEIDVDDRVGNYLFRVEVHDRSNQGGHEILTLKWSRDNGSEQFRVADAPVDFKQGDWIWEFFDDVTEKQLGVHLATGFTPKRGLLRDTYVVPVSATEPKTYARQWDGFCVLDLTTGLVTGGKDKGVALSAAYGDTAQGKVSVGSSLHINLDLLELDVNITSRAFVAGDFWQAMVREAAIPPDNYVLGTAAAGEPPAGIRHHYLRLAGFDGTGTLIAQTDAEKRRFHFPPLTDLRASDVGFTEHCHTLFNGALNVQDALDALCTLAADDVAYALPVCAATPSVASLLSATAPWPDLDADGKLTVKDMLDALLCRLDATRLPYAIPACGTAAAPSVRSLMSLAPGAVTTSQALDNLYCGLNAGNLPLAAPLSCDPNVAKAQTVQGALELLCGKSGDGCEVTVGIGGQYPALTDAFDAFGKGGAPQDMILCLLPGNHDLPVDASVLGKRSVKIMGSGTTASVIRFQGAVLRLAAQEIHLEDLALIVSQPSGRISLEAPDVSAEDCLFRRTGNAPGAPSLLTVVPPSGGNVYFENNTLISTWQRVKGGVETGKLAPVGVVGKAMSDSIQKLFTDAVLSDPELLDQELARTAEMAVALPQNTRAEWGKTPPQGVKMAVKKSVKGAKTAKRAPARSKAVGKLAEASALGMGIEASQADFYENISKTNVTANALKADLASLVFAQIETGFNQALALASIRVGGSLAHNSIQGELAVLNNGAAGVDVGKKDAVQVIKPASPVTASGAALELSHNEVARFSFQVDISLFDTDDNGALAAAIPALSVLNLNHNTFGNDENAFAAGVVNLNGNRFNGANTLPAGIALAGQLLGMGNSAGQGVSLRYRAGTFAFAANLLALNVIT